MTHLERAIEIATHNVDGGGGPFGAVLALPDGRTYEGTNRVTADNDPTAHAEVVAIRAACAGLGTFRLDDAVLYASCEPCPMCLAAALWARVGHVVFAADRHEAASAGFDDLTFHDQLARGVTDLTLHREPHPDRRRPFDAWIANPGRAEY